MPINNTVDENKKLIYSICSGEMRKEDFSDYIGRIWADDTHFGYNEIFDTTQGNWDNFDFGFLLSVAESAAKLNTIDPNSKLAWIVLEGKQKHLTDFYKSAKSILPVKSRSLEAFYTESDAMKWLG